MPAEVLTKEGWIHANRDIGATVGEPTEYPTPLLIRPDISRKFRVNYQIRVPEVRLIDEQNQQLGIVRTDEALRMAKERGLDLVEVSPVARPPVCRILDYGKFQYQLERQDRKSKAKQKKIDVKGIRLSLTIGEHDTEVRRGQAMKFLNEGHKVKVEIILRGRENRHRDRASGVLTDFIRALGDRVRVEQPLTIQGNRLSSILSL